MSSVFDPNAFMGQTTEGVGSTTITPIPAGEYLALIGGDEKSVNPVTFQDKQNPAETRVRLDVQFKLIDDSGAIKAAIDGREPQLTQGFFLDLVPNTFQLDMGKGKNVQLNKLREALNQNTGGQWAPGMLRGAGPIKISVAVQPDSKDPSIPRNVIKAFGKPA